MQIDDQLALEICTTAERRNDERTSLAGLSVLDGSSRIPMEPYVITMLCPALRERCPKTEGE